MSKKQWMVLLMLFLTYLLLGASIFYHIESRLEVENVAKAREERIEINALLHEHYMPKDAEEQHEILEKLTRYCGKSVYNYTANEVDPLKWDFYNSFYFAYTVVSTIGYGNLAPTNMLSRVLMIFYGVVGIPMNGILLTQLGEFFGIVFVRAHQKYKSYKRGPSDYSKKLTPLETRKAGLAAQIFMYLTPGFVMFIFFPAFLFSHYEGWSYDEAVYYAFVTLTTIGFGDYVAGQDNTKGSGVFFILYKTFLIVWISFGLGYIVMIMTFIARGMRSKKITRLEHKLAMNLKHTQSKIWNEFNKEVGYLRRVFNELQLSKVKRVYVDEYDYETPPAKFPRSNSFPDLRDLVYGGLANPLPPPHPRRRANSEVVPMEAPVARVVSETDLQRIDKRATFATHAMVQPAELLARLVNILGYIPPPPDDINENEQQDQSPEIEANRAGVQGFSDKEILANERGWNNCMWKLGGSFEKTGPNGRKPRSRAASEVRLDPKYDPNVQQRNVEWTWSGPASSGKIQELIKARRNDVTEANTNSTKETKTKFPNLALPLSVPKTLLPRWIKQLSNKRECGQRERNSVSAGELESGEGESYLTQPTGGFNMNGGHSGGLPSGYEDTSSRPYFTHTGAANLANSLEGSNLLEETSLADFLRALTALHTRVAGAVPEEYVRKPQRKMGTACLTPPKLPSLLTLFSPPSGMTSQSNQSTVTGTAASAARRFSLRTAENSGASTPNHYRRSSLAHQAGIKPRRRFSLRPVITPIGTPPQSNASPYLSGTSRHGKEWQEPTTPPSPGYSSDGFVVDCPKGPLVSMEGAPGVSTPVTASSGIGRFSLRPTIQTEINQPSQAPSNLTKGLPRWRAGMLQRQMNQINLQKRVRAFSLSDVNTEGSKSISERNTTLVPSPLVDGVRVLAGTKDLTTKSASQKTVTIVSPSPEQLASLRTNDSKECAVVRTADSVASPLRSSPTRVPFLRTTSASSNPFASVNETRSVASTNPFISDANKRTSNEKTSASDTVQFVSKGNFESDDDRSRNEVTSPTDYRSLAEPEGPNASRTVYQALRSVKNIEAAPPVFRIESVNKGEKSSDANPVKNIRAPQNNPEIELSTVQTDNSVKKESCSSSSTTNTDSKGANRKVSAVSIGHWTDSRRPGSRKVSTISQQSADSISSSSPSRKSSTNKNPGDKPRVSIDSYKPLMEVNIEKPSENPFERYKATMQLSITDSDSLTEVRVDSPDSSDCSSSKNQRRFSTKLGQDPRESTT